MKYLFPTVVLVMVCACSNKEAKKEPFPFIEVTEKEWAVYEGKMLTEGGLEAEVELSLKENAVGVDSYYQLQGVALSESEAIFNLSSGKFSVTYGLANQAMGVELKGKRTGRLMTSTVITHAKYPKRIVRRGAPESQNVYFRSNGSEQLIFSDDDFNPIAKDNRYTLYKRSKLFTAEGYLTITEGNPEFFERNTSENWKIARLGVYAEIDSFYRKLATLPYEGIYLRALAYTVADTTDAGEPTQKLVVKRVIEMNARH